MNQYETTFFASCPVNGKRIDYSLTIQTGGVIKVEHLLAIIGTFRVGYHEDFADHLHNQFGGTQILVAHHHGVTITTLRGTP